MKARVNRIIVFFSMVVLAFGCTRNVPKGVLGEKKMKLVLIDLMQADSYLANYRNVNDSTYNDTTKSIAIYQKIFDIHKITRETFVKSLNYYSANPHSLKPILDAIGSLASDNQKTNEPTSLDDALQKDTSKSEDSIVLPHPKKTQDTLQYIE